MNRQNEANKVRLLEVKGNYAPNLNEVTQEGEGILPTVENVGNTHHPAEVDENYLVVGNYVEESVRTKIENGEYVNFSRLLPRDRLSIEEDNRMEIVNKNGKTYFVPASDVDQTGGITSFSRWEQEFRVFSNIYTRRFPHRAFELIQYNHVIHTAALSFTWENVYLYNRAFRLHLAQFLYRSWSVILQQAWTMKMKDRVFKNDDNRNSSNGNKNKTSDYCKRFNCNCTIGVFLKLNLSQINQLT